MWICYLLRSAVFQTVISGVVIFIAGQLFIEIVLTPLRRYNQLRAKAAYCLTFYANRFDPTTEISTETSEELRKIAAELDAYATEKPAILFLISREKLGTAAASFIGLSNSVDNRERGDDFRNKQYENIRKALKLKRER